MVCMFSSCWMALACSISPANRKRGKQVLTNKRRRLIGPTFAPDLNGRNSVEPAVNGIAAIFSISSSLPLFFSKWTRIYLACCACRVILKWVRRAPIGEQGWVQGCKCAAFLLSRWTIEWVEIALVSCCWHSVVHIARTMFVSIPWAWVWSLYRAREIYRKWGK